MQKFIILCIIRISSFTAGLTTDPSASVRLAAVLDRSAEQQNNGLFILSHLRTPSTSLHGYIMSPFDEIWSCRWAWYGMYTQGDRCGDGQRSCRRDCRADWSRPHDHPVCQNSQQPRCWPWVWRYIRGQQYNIRLCDVRKLDWRRYRGQKCCSVGKLLHIRSWNVSWLNSWKSNPMYNMHPKLYSKILGKKVRIISEILRYFGGRCGRCGVSWHRQNITSYLCPSLEAFRQLLVVKQMIVYWVLIKFVFVVVLLHATLVWIQKVQSDDIDVEQKEADQYPRRPFETDSNYQSLKHDELRPTFKRDMQYENYLLRNEDHAHFLSHRAAAKPYRITTSWQQYCTYKLCVIGLTVPLYTKITQQLFSNIKLLKCGFPNSHPYLYTLTKYNEYLFQKKI